MTRKDYIEIGEILRETRPMTPSDKWEALVQRFSDMFEDDNPNFDRERFLDFCFEQEDEEAQETV